MICQRCGSCCIGPFVVIRIGDRLAGKPPGKACPHLSFKNGEATCAVHDQPWFTEMPCHVYGNSELDPDFLPKKGKPCRVGQLVRSNGGPQSVMWAGAEELEDLGPASSLGCPGKECDADTDN